VVDKVVLGHLVRISRNNLLCTLIFKIFFFSNSRINPLACSSFYEFHILRGLPGSLLPLGLYQRACFSTRPPSILPTCSSQSCLCLLILSLIENTPNSFLISSFLILSSLVYPFTDLKNHIYIQGVCLNM
jgi:hypothetical protein